MLKLDSLYIHRRGFTSSSTINHQSVLPAFQGAWACRARRARERDARALAARSQRASRVETYAPSEFAPTRWATPPHRCHSPPCCGVYLRACGGLRRARAEAVYCSASCRVKAWRKRQRGANDTQSYEQAEAWERALRNPEYMAFKSPHWGNVWRSGLCWTVAWRARTWERANPRRRPLPTPRGRRAGAMAARGCQQTRDTGPRGRLERGDDL